MESAEEKVEVTRRGGNRRTYSMVSLALLMAFGALIYVQTRPRLVWYVSPPIDEQGRRVHVLCPVGMPAEPSLNGRFWDYKDEQNYGEIVLNMPPPGRSANLVERLNVRLHIFPINKTTERVTLMVGRAIHPGARGFGHYVDVNDAVEQNRSGRTKDYVWVSRIKVAVPGGSEGVRVTYEGPIENGNSMDVGKEICRSLYVK